MKQVWIALILLASLVPANARAAEDALLTDPAGDATWAPTAAGVPLPGPPTAGADFARGNDLRALFVRESADALAFTVAVDSMQGEPQGTVTVTRLAFGDREYRLWMSYFTGTMSTSQGRAYASLQRLDGDAWSFVARLDDPDVKRDAGTISASVPKVYLSDSASRTPGRGDALDVIDVVADANFVGLGIAQARVRDEMAGGVAVTMTLGDFSTGDLTMTSPDRVRVSNGGATTFVFRATLANGGERAHEMRLDVEDMPEGWQARVQPSVTLPPGEARTVALLVSVPFAHEHGGYSSLNLTATSATDAATQGRLRLGVVHTPIPQPTGHHPELYLHASNAYGGPLGAPFEAAQPSAWGWMNTLAEHDEDHPFVTPRADDGALDWWIPLDPRLLVGLDFDLDALAKLEGEIQGGVGDVEVEADLYYYRDTPSGGELILLARGSPTPLTLDRSSPQPFSLTLAPTPESDYIPYAPDTYLTLLVRIPGFGLDTVMANPERPRLVTQSFKLALPLHEYHDRLSGEAELSSSISIVAKGPVEKAGRGGSVLAYAFDVSGASGQSVVVDLAGSDAHLARVAPSGALRLGDGATEMIVGVEIPVDAKPGEEYEVLLFVHAQDDPTKMAIARTKTRVAAQGDDAAADERATLLEAESRHAKTPAPGALALLAVAAALALGRRR